VEDWSFDVFRINEAGEGHALKYVGYELMQRYNLVSKFKVWPTPVNIACRLD